MLPYLVVFGILAWGFTAWAGLRARDPVVDWNGWRQADTQTIALNLMRPDASIFRPQINWGGDGPGYVETEFQLYPWLIARSMLTLGQSERPGQLLSLFALSAAAMLVWTNLKESYGADAAIFGVVAFFGSRSVPYLSTVIQPDGLALSCFAASWLFWTRYLRREEVQSLIGFAVFGGLAMLIKPTQAQVGVASFAMVLLADPKQLRTGRLWLAWGAMVLVLTAHLVHANQLYREYGNTFGVLAGGDSKLPHVQQLWQPANVLRLIQNGLLWGIGYLSAPAALYLLIRRRLTPLHWGLTIGLAVMALIAFRYTARDAGNYYFAPGAILGAHLVAAAARELLDSSRDWSGSMRNLTVVGVTLLLWVQVLLGHRMRYHDAKHPHDRSLRVAVTGRALSRLARPGDLVIVRSTDSARDLEWGTANNYEDPRLFYLSATHGWVLDIDETDPTALARAARRGAKFYADPTESPPQFGAWLASHAKLQPTPAGAGQIWRL